MASTQGLQFTTWKGEQLVSGEECNLGELLLTAARDFPDRVCLEGESGAHTFSQLAGLVTPLRQVLRRALRSLGAVPPAEAGTQETQETQVDAHRRRPDEHVVTIVLERGVTSIAAVHAVMLEGCAYNAFDISDPVDKLRSWVEVSSPPVMISSRAVLQRLGLTDMASQLGPYPQLVLDVDLALKKGVDANAKILPASFSPDDMDRLAYVIFTSGSTGKPKAVMIRHRSALNVVRIWGAYVDLEGTDRFAQVASMSWDVHIIEVYGAMAARATSVTCPDMIKKSGPDMLRWLQRKHISGMSVVPSHLRTIASGGADVSATGLPQLRILDVGGEALGTDVVDTWAPGRRLFNSYGPSEISVVCTGGYVQRGGAITIGQALPTYRCHILDPVALTAKEEGERGVLFIGGIGLARGYLEEEQKTQQKFLDLPGLGRVYNTGDLASRDPDGNIHFHGRVDWQVKVRGVRIELEALEQAILELPSVNHCEARVSPDGQQLRLLVSLVAECAECAEEQKEGEKNVEAVEAELKAKALSLGRGYMLSQVKVVRNSDWKFNTSGKLLRNVVPLDPSPSEQKTQDPMEAFDRAGASDLELAVAASLAPALPQLDRWTRHSHFMEELGVDSAGCAKFVGNLEKLEKGGQRVKVDLQMVYDYPSVRALAAAISDLSSGNSDSEDEDPFEAPAAPRSARPSLLRGFLEVLASAPHAVCIEEGNLSASYGHVFRLALAYQRMLRSTSKNLGTAEGQGVVALSFGSPLELTAGMVATLLEGHAFCVLDPTLGAEDVLERLRLAPLAVLGSGSECPSLQLALERLAERAPAWADASQVTRQLLHLTRPLKPRAASGHACARFAVAKGGLQMMRMEHSELQSSVEALCTQLQLGPGSRFLSTLPLHDTRGIVALWSSLAAASTMVFQSSMANVEAKQTLLSRISDRRPTVLSCFERDFAATGMLNVDKAAASGLKTICVLDAGRALQHLCVPWVPAGARLLAVQSHACESMSLSADSFASISLVGSESESEGSGVEGLPRATSVISTQSSLGDYILSLSADGSKHWGSRAWPRLCAVIQGLLIFSQPLFVACRLVIAERLLLPFAMMMPIAVSLMVLIGLLVAEQFFRFFVVFAAKWLLIGRYRPGTFDIYSMMYLRHWIVEHLAKGSIVGQAAHQGSSLAFLFVRNLALKALGAKISSSAVLTARVVAYDLVTVGDLATVHGPRHLTAATYGGRSMCLKKLTVGAGAYVGPNCTLEPGCKIEAGAYVEPLSSVREGQVISGRATGVPAVEVGPQEPGRVPKPEEVDSFVRWAALFASGYWTLMLPQAVLPLVLVVFFRLLGGDNSLRPMGPVDLGDHDTFDALPPTVIDRLQWLPVMAFGASILSTVFQLSATVLVCRLLPKVRPPCSFSLASFRAQVAAMKMSMVLKSSEMLADASLVPTFIRLCGAQFGHGCAMGLQVTLPETLRVGEKCFFATGNILSSVDVDLGRFNVPFLTEMGDRTFLGNHNHLPQGLPEGCFCGVGTWLPERPQEKDTSFFGNPAMKFRRVSPGKKANQGPEAASCLARAWHHFSTSIMDVFLYRGVQGATMAISLCLGRWFVPYISHWWEVTAVIALYAACSLTSWYLFSVLFGNLLFNGKVPAENAYYSTAVTRWFTALTAQQRVFKLPFQTAGSCWQAPILRLLGAKIGKRFFCLNELVLVDAPFTEVGDDVTVDYDGQVRCHSFEDFRLKFTHYKVGSKVTIMAGASVAMCNAEDGAVLLPGSITWKGRHLAAGTTYDGAPASSLDVEKGAGAGGRPRSGPRGPCAKATQL